MHRLQLRRHRQHALRRNRAWRRAGPPPRPVTYQVSLVFAVQLRPAATAVLRG